ncbi:TIM barrel protein [Gordonia spumicola]|uniref:TIM barrel protein n=1 Tax=Gordonia spumicola TaxID=589161 RepID=UPI00137B5648|nr:TIM barrel protein [Gordonia spumicola]
MTRAISIELIWRDRPFPERAVAAARAGFDLVDLWDRRTSDLPELAEACADNGIGINGFFGNRDNGLADPDGGSAALDEIARNLEAAHEVGARQLHVFSNAILPGGIVKAVPAPRVTAWGTAVENLSKAADMAREAGVQLMLEHLNSVYLPGYLWSDAGAVAAVAREVGRAEVRGVFDTYHQQLTAGRLVDTLIAGWDQWGRIDIAGVPGRCEPGKGEIDFRYLQSVITERGWDGPMTFEITPSGDPDDAMTLIDDIFPKDRP